MILIGPKLEQALAAINCYCDIPIAWDTLDQIGRDLQENHVDSKQYVLHDSKRMHLSATVSDYEPETITLNLDRGRCKHFDSIVSATSSTDFSIHAYFLDRPSKPPSFLMNAVSSAHAELDSNHSISRIRFVAVHRMNAITRCFLSQTKLMPTPYLVYATNARTMQTQQLNGDNAKPYTIKGYK